MKIMYKSVLLFLLISLSAKVKCDTIPNWQVYYNHKIWKALNINYDPPYTLTIKASRIDDKDSITVYYSQCEQGDGSRSLAIEDFRHHVYKIITAQNRSENLTLSAKDLIAFAEIDGKRAFDFYLSFNGWNYSQNGSSDNRLLLFHIQIDFDD